MTNVTILGTGIMGSGIAKVLADSDDFAVTVWNRTAIKAEELAKQYPQINAEGDIVDAIKGADIVFLVAFDGESTLELTKAINGNINEDCVLVQCATIGSKYTVKFSDYCKEQGVKAIEANMMGSKPQADTGELVYIVGGDEGAFECVKPALECTSKKIVYCGRGIGDGTAVKLACNSWLSFLTSGTAWVVALLKKQGVDPNLWLDVIMDATTASPYAAIKGTKMIDGDYSTQFAVDALIKDLGLAKDAARTVDLDVNLIDTIRDLFIKSSDSGHGNEDIAAVHKNFID